MQKNHGGVVDVDPAKPESLLDAADHLVVSRHAVRNLLPAIVAEGRRVNCA
jgi:hypothetical protein